MTFADLKILMARRYYRRRTITRAPRKKWASNIVTFTESMTNPFLTHVLVTNAAQTASPTPVIVKVGNFKCQLDASYMYETSGANVLGMTAYIMYVPEGITVTTNAAAQDLIAKHPEWIMAWRQFNMDGIQTATAAHVNSVTFSSRLKRNLNSGDSIQLFVVPHVSGTVAWSGAVTGTVQYWNCAN